MNSERVNIAIRRVENMISKHYDKAPKEFTEDLILLVNIAKKELEGEK